MGGDRNVFYRKEGRPIRRSSHILVEGQTSTEAIYTADELFKALEGEDCRVIAITEQEFDPYGAPPRPKARTTEDYLREREASERKGDA